MFTFIVLVLQVKDVLFEPVRKTQDAMFFIKTPNGMWMPCGPKQSGAVQITMQDLAGKGLGAKVRQMLTLDSMLGSILLGLRYQLDF